MPSDESNSMGALCQSVAEFVRARDWEQFHSPKNVAAALSVEAAELLEHFQWLGNDDSRKLLEDPVKKDAVAEELADVVIYAMAFANTAKMDLADIVKRKLEKNAKNYPVDKARGNADKYTEL